MKIREKLLKTVRKIMVWTFIAVFLMLSVSKEVHAEEDEIPSELRNLYAQSAVLIDADSGRVLFGKNADEQKAMASTTKIMTCILALENGNLEDVVTVTANAAKQPKVHLGMREGEQYYLKDLLYSLMLESHNDSAVAIAEHIGGSVEGFADMMNQKAEKIGCSNTYYITPNGLDASDDNGIHSTTAADLARVMKYCVNDSPSRVEFMGITAEPTYSFADVTASRMFNCNNHNAFLTMMEGAFSGKTGFTGEAGYCYVGALRYEGKTLIVALLACGWPNNKSYKWTDTKKLMEYGLNNYQSEMVWREPELPVVSVENGIPYSGSMYEEAYADISVKVSAEEMEQKMLLGEGEEIIMEVNCQEVLSAPVTVNQEIGKVVYRLEDMVVAEYPILVTQAVEEKSFGWCFDNVKDLLLMSQESK